MTLSEILAFLSLLGYVAMWGQSIWKTRLMSKDDWGLYNHKFDKMPEVIKWALRYCLRQGFIVIADRNSEHFIQFRKYILRNGEYGLELGFPEAGWSKVYFPKLRDALAADDIPFREARETCGNVTAFIHVDCGQNIDKAVYLARRCFFDIFGLALDTHFKSSPSNYSTLYDHVDDPDYVNPSSASDWWSTWRAREEAKGRPDPALVLKAAAFTTGWLTCYIALWVSWFVAERTPPAWQWEIGSVQLAGSHSTWMLLLIFCAMLVGGSRAYRKLIQTLRPRPKTLIDRIGGPLANFGLPMAVTISWLGL